MNFNAVSQKKGFESASKKERRESTKTLLILSSKSERKHSSSKVELTKFEAARKSRILRCLSKKKEV
jgi:hypothetical protein